MNTKSDGVSLVTGDLCGHINIPTQLSTRSTEALVASVVEYLNNQIFKYYLNIVTGIWKQYLDTA